MAPAIECGCGYKIKTAHEPATDREMAYLIQAAIDHQKSIILQVNYSIRTGFGSVVPQTNPTEKISLHEVLFNYFSITPTEGYEEAKIISEKDVTS
jgi:hypothetical protein